MRSPESGRTSFGASNEEFPFRLSLPMRAPANSGDLPTQEPLSGLNRHRDGRRNDLEAPGPAAPPPGYAPYPTPPPLPQRPVSLTTIMLSHVILRVVLR